MDENLPLCTPLCQNQNIFQKVTQRTFSQKLFNGSAKKYNRIRRIRIKLYDTSVIFVSFILTIPNSILVQNCKYHYRDPSFTLRPRVANLMV